MRSLQLCKTGAMFIVLGGCVPTASRPITPPPTNANTPTASPTSGGAVGVRHSRARQDTDEACRAGVEEACSCNGSMVYDSALGCVIDWQDPLVIADGTGGGGGG